MKDYIELDTPSDVAPIRHAYWKLVVERNHEHRHYCSACDTRAVCGEDSWGYDTEDILTDFCPWCGAKMDGENPQ